MIDYMDYYNYNKKLGETGTITWTNTSNDLVYRPKIKYMPPDDIFYEGERYKIDNVDKCVTTHGDVEINIHASKVACLNGFSGTFIIDDPGFINDFKRAFNPYAIKKVIVNPKKNATTVLWADGTHTVVKRSEGDEPADIWSVVSYALAEKIYGSNSAFKREIKGKVERMKE